MILFQERDDNLTVRWNLVWTVLAAGVVLMGGCEPLGLWNEEDSGPRVEMSTQEVKGNSTVVQGDTIIFRRVRRENAPCHFYDESCDLPPIPASGGDNTIHLKNGYFLAPGSVQLQGDVNRDGDEIHIRIWPNRRQWANGAPSVTEPVLYTAWVRGLSSGTYELRVIHERDALRVTQGNNEEGTPAVVSDTTVTVN